MSDNEMESLGKACAREMADILFKCHAHSALNTTNNRMIFDLVVMEVLASSVITAVSLSARIPPQDVLKQFTARVQECLSENGRAGKKH